MQSPEVHDIFDSYSLDKWPSTARNKKPRPFFLAAYRIIRELLEMHQEPLKNKERGFMVHANVLAENIYYIINTNTMQFYSFVQHAYVKSNDARTNIDSLTEEKYLKSDLQSHLGQHRAPICGPEWEILKLKFSKTKPKDGLTNQQRFDFLKDKVTEVIGKAFTRIKGVFHIDNLDPDTKSVIDNYWNEFFKVHSKVKADEKIQKANETNNALLDQAIATYDLYGMGYLLLSKIGELRNFLPESEKYILNDMATLCMRAINGNPFARISWPKFLTEYENVCFKHKLEPKDPDSFTEFNTLQFSVEARDRGMGELSIAAGKKSFDLESLITRLYRGQNLNVQDIPKDTPTNISDLTYNESNNSRPFDIEDFQGDLTKPQFNLLVYIYCTLYGLKSASYGFCYKLENSQTPASRWYLPKDRGATGEPWVLVDVVTCLIVVFWPQEVSVAWVWSLNDSNLGFNDVHELDQKNVIELRILALISQGQEKFNLNSETSKVAILCTHFIPNDYIKTFIGLLGNSFEVTACMTKMVCMALTPMIKLRPQVKRIAGLIRDYGAASLTARMNKSPRNSNDDTVKFSLRKIDVEIGIIYTLTNDLARKNLRATLELQRDRFNELFNNQTSKIEPKADNTCKKSLPEASWLIRGLAEYGNATFKVTGAFPEKFAFVLNYADDNYYPTGHPLHASANFTYADTETAYVAIVNEFMRGSEVRILMPRIAKVTEKIFPYEPREYVQWFMYNLKLDQGPRSMDSSRWTLNVTTPESHVYEVAQLFVRYNIQNIVAEIQNLAPNHVPIVDVIRNYAENKILKRLDYFSNDYFVKGTYPTKNDVALWLQKFREFLTKTCSYAHDPVFDERCFCKDSDCPVKNKKNDK